MDPPPPWPWRSSGFIRGLVPDPGRYYEFHGGRERPGERAAIAACVDFDNDPRGKDDATNNASFGSKKGADNQKDTREQDRKFLSDRLLEQEKRMWEYWERKNRTESLTKGKGVSHIDK